MLRILPSSIQNHSLNALRGREWFWIEDGKIRNIWTAMYYPGPERAVPNWPPFDGNFPLDAATAAQPTASPSR